MKILNENPTNHYANRVTFEIYFEILFWCQMIFESIKVFVYQITTKMRYYSNRVQYLIIIYSVKQKR